MLNTNLTHLPEKKQHTLAEIRRLILNEVEKSAERKEGDCYIQWLVLFGSYARGTYVENPINGYFSDYDILIAVHGRKLAVDLKLWGSIENKLERLTRTPVSLIVHTHQEVSQWLSEGHYFFKDIRDEGIYLYSRNNKEMPYAKNLTNAERLPIAKKHYEQWFESADEFLDTYSYDFKKGRSNKAAFELHQATERFFACALLVLTNYRPYSHNLKMLRYLLINCTSPDSPFLAVFPWKDRFQRRSFERLKRAYVEARYSEHFEITVEELEWLAGEVTQLKEATKRVCEAYILRLEKG